MKINLKLDLDDATRNALACQIAGKPVKRLATRADVVAYVDGALARLLEEDLTVVEPAPSFAPKLDVQRRLTGREQEVAARLRREGRDEGYIRGWLHAGRVLAGRYGAP